MRKIALISAFGLLISSFASGQWYDSLSVIACGPDTFIKQIPLYFPRPEIWDPVHNRLYITCRESWPYYTKVLDCATDSIVDSLRVFFCSPTVLDTADNKIYALSSEYYPDFIVIDVDADSTRVLKYWLTARCDLAWSSRSNKLYFSYQVDRKVYVYDCTTDSVVNELNLCAWQLCLNPAQDKLYLQRHDSVYVVDVPTDSVRGVIHRYRLGYDPPMWNPVDSLVYLFSNSRIWKVDSRGDSVVDSLVGDFSGRRLCLNTGENILYLLDGYWWIKAIDLTSGEVLARVPGFEADMCVYDSVDNRIYGIRDFWDAVVYVYDCSTNQVIRQIWLPNINSWGIVWNPRDNKLYCGGNPMMRAVKEKLQTGYSNRRVGTVVRGVLYVPQVRNQSTKCKMVLLDAIGRKAVNLHPGANDIRHLSPGVYFLRSEKDIKTTKVIIGK